MTVTAKLRMLAINQLPTDVEIFLLVIGCGGTRRVLRVVIFAPGLHPVIILLWIRHHANSLWDIVQEVRIHAQAQRPTTRCLI